MIKTIWLDFLNEPVGYIGMGLFWLAWIVQLYQSYVHKKSIISVWWWILRAIGVGCMLIHAIIIQDLLFIISNALTLCIVYSYNLYLIARTR